LSEVPVSGAPFPPVLLGQHRTGRDRGSEIIADNAGIAGVKLTAVYGDSRSVAERGRVGNQGCAAAVDRDRLSNGDGSITGGVARIDLAAGSGFRNRSSSKLLAIRNNRPLRRGRNAIIA
jgi:hypothetical protein